MSSELAALALTHIPGLEELDLGTLKIWRDIDCEHIGPKKLQHKFIGIIVERCVSLCKLSIANSYTLQPETIQSLATHCSLLQSVDLNACRLIDDTVSCLSNSLYLRELNLSHCT